MSLHITNMTDDPILLTVVQGEEPHDRLIRVSNHANIFNREILQQQSLPTGGKDPIRVQDYKDGWNITLVVDPEYSVIAHTIEFRTDHAAVLEIRYK